jgi:hypothetical protein
MLERFNDIIEIRVCFSPTKVLPESFVWQGRLYYISKVNMIHSSGSGLDKVYYFSVSDEANFFKLAFYVKDLSWRIEELYYTG